MDMKLEIELLKTRVQDLEARDKKKDALIGKLRADVNELFERVDLLEKFVVSGRTLMKRLSWPRRSNDLLGDAQEWIADTKVSFFELFAAKKAPAKPSDEHKPNMLQ